MVFSNNLLFGLGGQTPGPATFDSTLIGNSVWFDGSADYMDKTFSSGSAQSRIVYACWLQRNDFTRLQSIFTANKSGRADRFGFQADDTIDIHLEQSGGSTIIYSTSNVFRDTGWYHFILSIDLNVIQANAVQLYVNGVPNNVTVTFGPSAGALSTMDSFGNSGIHAIGKRGGASDRFSNTYQTQCTFLVGQSIQNGDVAVTDFLDTFTFGTNGSQFIPKSDANIAALASTAGGNSFCLDFANSSDLGNDISSNNNNFATDSTGSTIAAANQSTSTPSLTFSTYNILDANAAFTSTNDGANTYVVTNVGGAGMRASLPITSGKWYWEQRNGGSNECGPAISAGAGFVNLATNSIIGEGSGSHSVYLRYDNVIRQNASNGSAIGITNGATAVMGVAFDADTGKVWFRDSSGFGTSGDPANGTGEHATLATTSAPFFIAARVGGAVAEPFLNAGGNPTFNGNETAGGNADANGRGNFKLGAVPTGFLSLNTANLSAPTYQGIDYFAPTLYEGNGTGQRVGDFVPFTDAYTVDKSAMFNSADLRYLARTPSSGGNEKTLTFSTWIKITGVGNSNENAVLTTDDGSKEAQIRITGTTLATKKVQANLYNGSSFVLNISTDRTFGDTSSWNHLVVAYDTRAAVASANKVIIYINGVRQSVSGTDLATDDYDTEFNSTNEHNIGRQTNNGVGEPDFYLAETVMIDGQQLDATSFGQLDTSTNRWVPKDVSGLTFGTNGFYLQYGSTFASGSGAGTDTSGNSPANNWTESTDGGSAWSTSDQFVDTPSANFPTLDTAILPVPTDSTGGNATMSEGNLKFDVDASTNSNSSAQTTPLVFQIPDGKWYYELESVDSAGGNIHTGLVDMFDASKTLSSGFLPDAIDGQVSYGIGGSSTTTDFVTIDGTTLSGTSSPFNGADDIDNGDVLGVYIEKSKDTYNFWFSRNGTMLVRNTSQTPMITYSRANPMCVFVRSTNGTTKECALNFGQQMVFDGGATTASAATGGRWKHVPTNTAYKALNVDNLDNTASKLTALAWIKNRDATDNHMLANRVRGPQFINNSSSNSTGETTNVNAIQRFLQRGVQVGSDVEVNTANESYVLWQWLMGDSATTGSTISAGSISTDPVNVPSIASTVLVADADHMSIGTFTGTGSNGTVGHGLSAAPEAFVVFNPTVAARFKMFYHKDSNASPASGYIHLESTEAFQPDSTIYNNTVPNSTVFSVGTNVSINENTKLNTFIAWRSVPGVCKVGSYIGNSDDDGPYLSLGFKPAWWMVKETTVDDASHDWFVADSARYTFNGTTTAGGLNGGTLEANDTTIEEAHNTNFTDNPAFDFLSDGIKLRTNSGTINATGRTYIYLAMADIGGNGTLPPVYGR